MIALLLALLVGPVHVQTLVQEGRPALRVTAPSLDEVSVERIGDELVVCLGGVTEVDVVPNVEAPLAFTTGVADCGFRIAVPAEADLAHELRREPGELLLLLGEESLLIPSANETPDLQALMSQLWPGRVQPEAPTEDGLASVQEDEELVLRLGPLELRPLLSLFVGAQAASLKDTPEPEEFGWLILEPGLRAGSSLLDGRLQLQYRPTFRRFQNTSFDGRTSHHYDARLTLEPLPLVRLEAHGNHARGLLETREVDPGAEYFFGLRPFRRTGAGVLLGVDRGGMADLDLTLDWARTDLDPGSLHFDNDQWTAGAALRRDLGGDRALSLYYRIGWSDRVPERPVAESRTGEYGIVWTGRLIPSLPVNLTLGRQHRIHDAAPGASREFVGAVLSTSISREFSWGGVLDLTGHRSTYLSGFEENGYYTAKGIRAALSGGLPLHLRMVGAIGLQWNDYPLPAAAIGEPRHDVLQTFAIGISRTLWESVFVRLDYQRERRNSNLPGFSNRTGGFMFGVGFARRKELL